MPQTLYMTLLRVKKQLVEHQDAMNADVQHILALGNKPTAEMHRHYAWLVQQILVCNTTLQCCRDALRGRSDSNARDVSVMKASLSQEKGGKAKKKKRKRKQRRESVCVCV